MVKAFTSNPAQVIALPREMLAQAQVAALVCSDDEAARKQVMELASELGFQPSRLRRARVLSDGRWRG